MLMTENSPIELLLDWHEVHHMAKELCAKLRASGQSWDRIIAVTRGGMVPACIVARELDMRVIDTVSVESYAHQDQSEAKILKSPQHDGTGKGLLIVDDLSDTGNTFAALRKQLPDATYACLYVKPQGKGFADIYAVEVTQNTWIYFPWEDQDFPPHIAEQARK